MRPDTGYPDVLGAINDIPGRALGSHFVIGVAQAAGRSLLPAHKSTPFCTPNLRPAVP
jgi:hypothetical protein